MSLNHMPKHVAIIMDGNGRWARKRLFPRILGHRAGIKSVYSCIEYAVEYKIERLTLFAFGRENWQRPKEEVSTLMTLFSELLTKHLPMLKDNNICLNVVGDRSRLYDKVLDNIHTTESETSENRGLQLNIAIDYSGQWEIIEAVKSIAKEIQAGALDVDGISKNLFECYLQKHITQPVDLFIRTSGEQRISNFMNWQLSYAEFYFCLKMWPDFKKKDFQAAINSFLKRKRRFGKTDDQL
jgi:undecaprenyl diphosphate synthase